MRESLFHDLLDLGDYHNSDWIGGVGELCWEPLQKQILD